MDAVPLPIPAPTDIQEEISPLPPHLPEPEETLDEAAAAAAAAMEEAAAAVGEMEQGLSVEEDLKKIHEQQREQTQLIVNMQSMINNLSSKQSDLEDEIRGLKGGRWVVKAEPKRSRRGDNRDRVSQAQALLSVGGGNGSGIDGTTEDDEIDDIIESRKEKKTWPLKRKYCSSFTNEVDLLKIRFHRSDKHSHKSVRIPKVDKNEGYGLGNKEGRLICRLCSGKTINRNTSWMCVTCCVPLCVDIVNGDPESSCHSRWHGCQDLATVNATLNSALRERRESKKRSRDSMNSAEVSAEAVRQAAALAAPVFVQPKVEVEEVEVPVEMEIIEEHQHVQVDPIAIIEEQQQVDPNAIIMSTI